MSTNPRDYATPPGATLEEILEDREISKTDLSTRLGVSAKHVNQILRGKAPISADVAIGLENVLGVSAEFWIARESNYRAAIARCERDADWASQISWANQFPLKDLRRYKLIDPKARDVALVDQMTRFFGVADPSAMTELSAAFRSTNCFDSDKFAVQAWLRWGLLQAEEVDTKPFDRLAFRSAIDDIRGMTRDAPEEWFPRMVESCANAGVSVVLTPTFDGVRATGAAWWRSPSHAVIQLSNRHKWEDIFWFSFFHESAHILLHQKKRLFLEPKKRPNEETADAELLQLEREADKFAAELLVPPALEGKLETVDLDNEKSVRHVADLLDIAPAIVVGRVQRERGQYNKGNQLRRKFEVSVS